MRTSNSGLGILLSLIAGSVFACSSASKAPQRTAEAIAPAASADSGAEQAPGLLGGNGDAAPSQDCTSGTPQGCPCATAGQTVACWTGPAASRGTGLCQDGTQTCVAGQGEVGQSTWGPCTGEVLTCGPTDADGGVDAAPVTAVGEDSGVDTGAAVVVTADAAAAPMILVAQAGETYMSAASCTDSCTGCVPGTVIGCYDDCNAKEYCNTTMTETCQPNGTWGACTEGGTKTVDCSEIWGNCANFNNGAGAYEGSNCAAAFAGCATPVNSCITPVPGLVGGGTRDPGAGTDDAGPGSPGGGFGGGAAGSLGSKCMTSTDCTAPLTCTNSLCL